MSVAAAAAAAAALQAGRRQAAGWRTVLSALQHVPLPQSQSTAAAAAYAPWRAAAVCSARGLTFSHWAAEPLQCPSRQQQQQEWQKGCEQPPWQPQRSWHSSQQQHFSNSLSAPLRRRLHSATGRRAQDASQPPPQQQRQQQQSPQKATKTAGALQSAGWSRREVVNLPNALSMLRLLSGPVIASWILDAQWELALPALAISGTTDWADGWAARRFNQPSVIGSYLDPLADKVLICSVVGALGWSGVLPGPVVVIIVGRDVLLVTGAFAARAKSLGWRWPGLSEFFRIHPAQQAADGQAGADGSGLAPAAVGSGSSSGSSVPKPAPAAPLVQPLYISKVNTVFQLGLVGTCIMHSWLGWPGEAAVWAGSGLTAGTTLWSCWAYLQAYRQGRVLAPAAAAAGQPQP